MTKVRFDTGNLQTPAADFDDIMRRALGVSPPADDPKKSKPATQRVAKKAEK